MDQWVINNAYQKRLAERSLVESPSSEGEYWSFRWYIDPISRGLSSYRTYQVHVSEVGDVDVIGPAFPQDQEEALADEQALQFIQERYEEYGLYEESGN